MNRAVPPILQFGTSRFLQAHVDLFVSMRETVERLRERLLNPFLAHHRADIAKDHALKKQRRFVPVLMLAGELGLTLPQPWLRAAIADASGAARSAPMPKSASP